MNQSHNRNAPFRVENLKIYIHNTVKINTILFRFITELLLKDVMELRPNVGKIFLDFYRKKNTRSTSTSFLISVHVQHFLRNGRSKHYCGRYTP